MDDPLAEIKATANKVKKLQAEFTIAWKEVEEATERYNNLGDQLQAMKILYEGMCQNLTKDEKNE